MSIRRSIANAPDDLVRRAEIEALFMIRAKTNLKLALRAVDINPDAALAAIEHAALYLKVLKTLNDDSNQGFRV